MRYGNTVGPFFDRIADTPSSFDFVEPTIGESAVPLDDVDPAAVRAHCEAADVDLVVHLPIDISLVQAAPEVADGLHAYLERALDLAAEMGAEKGVAHCDAGRGARGDVDRLRKNVRRLDEAGQVRGVEVVFENLGMLEKGYSLDTVGDVLADTGAAMCFDVGHAYQEGGQDAVDEFLASHADLVGHLHVHDVRGRGDSHVTVGAGEIDYDPVAVELAAAGFDGTVGVEVFAPDVRLCEHSMDVLRNAFQRVR